MDVTQIPFAKHIGIERKEECTLKLEPILTVQNHIQTIHASAQYALAETQTGLFLQSAFPELEDKVVAVLRGSSVKYKNPALSTLTAHASLEDASREMFLTSMHKKSRASITIKTELRDKEENITMIGEFHWFVQK